jgi:peroxiredoxin
MGLKIGEIAPAFNLPNVNGETTSLDAFKLKRVLVVIFTCNHCPYAQAYEDRLIDLANYYAVQGVQFVAINPNDAESYPADSFHAMQARAKKKQFPYPYLRDKTQEVAKAYGAEVTPDIFVFDKNRTLQYRGRIDDNWRNRDKVKEESLKIAISTLLSGGTLDPSVAEQKALGCSVKWKW